MASVNLANTLTFYVSCPRQPRLTTYHCTQVLQVRTMSSLSATIPDVNPFLIFSPFCGVFCRLSLAGQMSYGACARQAVGIDTLSRSVSVTMMSRLMLNLHEIASPHMTPVTDPSTDNSTTLLFTSRFGGVPGDTTRAEYSPDALELADPQTDLDDMPETVELEMRDMGVMTTRR